MSALDIPDHAMSAWAELSSELVELQAAGQRTVCQDYPPGWESDADAATRKAAARACGSCPLLDACREYAAAAREASGIWGGVDFGRPAGKST